MNKALYSKNINLSLITLKEKPTANNWTRSSTLSLYTLQRSDDWSPEGLPTYRNETSIFRYMVSHYMSYQSSHGQVFVDQNPRLERISLFLQSCLFGQGVTLQKQRTGLHTPLNTSSCCISYQHTDCQHWKCIIPHLDQPCIPRKGGCPTVMGPAQPQF